MEDAVRSSLSAWESFYVIVGSSGAALTGLQFVVMTLIRDTRSPSTGQSVDAFGTPTIVHFCCALLVASVLSAPWHALSTVAVVLGALGLAGVVYAAIVLRRTRAQTVYKPVLEDWIWHVTLPLAAYGALFGSAIALPRYADGALFVVAAAALLLLFIGIHNAWDTVTFLTVQELARKRDAAPTESFAAPAPPPPPPPAPAIPQAPAAASPAASR